MKTIVLLTALFAACIFGMAPPAFADNWDFNTDYPTATAGPNPDGVWSYGFYQGGILGLNPFVLSAANDYHPPATSGPLDIYWGNDTNGSIGRNPHAMSEMAAWPNGMKFLAEMTYLETPSINLSNKTAALFTAPTDGKYAVDAWFQSGVMNDADTDVVVIVNDVPVHNDRLTELDDLSTYSATLNLLAGHTISFVALDVHGEGDYNGGFHIINFNSTISQIPEPSAMLLLSIIAFTVVGFRSRRRK